MTRKARRRAQERMPKKWALIGYEFMGRERYMVVTLDSVYADEKPLATGLQSYMTALANLLQEKDDEHSTD